MILSPRHKAATAALLIIGVIFVPALTGFAAGAIGVRANAGPSQVASVGDTVTVDGSRSYTLSGNNLTYTWDFDEADGIQADATGVIASHLYNETGVFTVTLTADDGAQSDTDRTQVIVTSTNGTVPGVPNLPPVSIPPLTQLGFQNQSMVFDGTRSFDPNGDNLTFEWDFNDLDGLTPGGDANGSVVAWVYYAPGVYNITLIVSDGQGSDAGRTSAIVAADNGTVVPGVNLPPVAVAEGDQFGQEGERFYFNANRSFDLDGDDLRYMWDFDSTNGRTQINAEGIVVSRVFTAAGIYNLTLTVSDGKAQDTDFLEVIVTTELGGVPGVGNIPPLAIIRSPIPGQRYAPAEVIQFDACGSIDPDGNDDLLLYQWTWPDGAPVSTICDPTHAFAEGGVKPVQLLIEDEGGTLGFNSVTIYINGSGPLNRQPSGDIESNTTTRVGLRTNFTANFTDPDNDPLTYAWDFDLRDGVQEEATGRNVTWIFTDACSCTVTVLVLDGEHRGMPVIAFQNMQVDPKETFQPTARAGNDTTAQAGQGIIFDGSGNDTDGNITLYEWDFEGDGIFDYSNAGSGWTIHTYPVEGNYSAVLRVTDDDRLTATDTRRVIVTPRPNNVPVADAGPDKASETQGVQTFFHGTGTDSDGFITLYEWDFDSNGIYDWSNSTAGDAFHTYTSAGTYAAVLRVTDDRSARATDIAIATVRLNQPPTANAGPPQTVNAGEQVTLSGTGSRDPEGAIAKYSWDFDSSDGIQEEYTGVTAVHTYTKGNSYLVTLAVTDGFGQTSVDTVFVEVLQHGGVNLAVSDGGRKELAPEQSSSFLLNVTNTGDGTDSFRIVISGDNEEALTWYSVDAATISNLEAGGVRIVRLTVAIPRGTLSDQDTLIKVTASSVFDATKTSTVDVDTAVRAVPKIQVSFISFPTEVQAGSSIDVTVRVQNLGNADARIQFIVGGGDSGWLSVKTVLPQTVKPLKSLDLDFTLTVPPGTAGGMHTVAVSINDTRSGVTDTESIQLNVKGGGGILPALQAPALLLGLVAVAALLIRGSGPRKRR